MAWKLAPDVVTPARLLTTIDPVPFVPPDAVRVKLPVVATLLPARVMVPFAKAAPPASALRVRTPPVMLPLPEFKDKEPPAPVAVTE